MRNIVFLKNSLFFPKCSSSQIVDTVQKYLPRKSNFSVDIFILNNSFVKRVVLPKSNYPKELPILKWWLFGRSSTLKKQVFWKNNCCEELTVLEKELVKKSRYSEETAAPKKKLLCRCNYSEEVWRSNFSENEAVLKKSQHMQEGKSPFEKSCKLN